MKAETMLPDGQDRTTIGGVPIRKGTVGAFLVNARAWCDPSSGAAARAAAQRDIADALPALRALGLFDVMEIRDPALAAFVAARCGG
ncbi:hypothetical protein [Burkholderia alba]|uniref:hypothetical protein n=1 Tax=Burkholderia alba TaxID=2683677 RepID=UPI002B05821B|nr:hypothetical protein [Burkholderia alba]